MPYLTMDLSKLFSLTVVMIHFEREIITFYNYYNEDKEFKALVDDISNMSLDFAESKLLEQIKDGSTAATIFYLKTKGKKRGYVERQEITGAGGIPTDDKIEIVENANRSEN